MTNELELELDKRNLKIQALLEKISNLTTNYENQEADYRVEITLLNKIVEGFNAKEEDQDSDGK